MTPFLRGPGVRVLREEVYDDDGGIEAPGEDLIRVKLASVGGVIDRYGIKGGKRGVILRLGNEIWSRSGTFLVEDN